MSHPAFPRADLSRFAPLAAGDLLLAYLGGQKTAPTLKALADKLKDLLGAEPIVAAASELAERGLATLEAKPKGRSRTQPNPADAKVVLTDAGRDAASALLGSGPKLTWPKVMTQRLLPLCLGLDPNGASTRLAKPKERQAAIIATAFGLPKETIGLNAVCEELVWRTLKAGLGPLLGTSRMPIIKTLGITEWVILAGLGGLPEHRPVREKDKTEVLNALTGAAVGLPEADDKAAVFRVLRLSLARAGGMGAASPHPTPTPPPAATPTVNGADGAGFAERVRQVAAALTTPPFQGRVAIAQVYDAYGREHPDAGSLQSFKARLIAAAYANLLELGRLDMPERMDRDLRLRSEAAWGRDCVHFVITGRR
ncbi:hypothetical protein [Xanthobacter agilis]|uniref:Uncharacterized protein n=1 Tax=Xanthobacter agilis TaxID=47492 RepID=A0ABU0L9I0_XANAG|nr:hypothetical protein [Xanthobacter agilis]MDQ0503778.1 hypothetical protein [Xanthobacter agilis]